MKAVAADVGGTHIRFAIAEFAPGERPKIGKVSRYRVADHDGLASAWRRFAEEHGKKLPEWAALGVAAPMGEDVLRFINSDWTVDTRTVSQELGLSRLTLLNDFGAMAHMVSVLSPDELLGIHGEGPLPEAGVTTIMGPGTGLGVAILVRRSGRCEVIETEASHIAYAPMDAEEDAIAKQFRRIHGRVSVERLVSGPGFVNIFQFLSAEDQPDQCPDSATLWQQALEGTDQTARRALEHFILAFGSVAGDFALAHGSNAVVLTGGLANRMIALLRSPLFVERFCDKGRYRSRMARIPVLIATHPEPGLLGAAVAFEREHLSSMAPKYQSVGT